MRRVRPGGLVVSSGGGVVDHRSGVDSDLLLKGSLTEAPLEEEAQGSWHSQRRFLVDEQGIPNDLLKRCKEVMDGKKERRSGKGKAFIDMQSGRDSTAPLFFHGQEPISMRKGAETNAAQRQFISHKAAVDDEAELHARSFVLL